MSNDALAIFGNNADAAPAQAKLWGLLARQTALYTGGDTSVRTETARDLLMSICYILRLDTAGGTRTLPSLNDTDIDAEFESGKDIAAAKLKCAKRLWRDILSEMPNAESISMRDTVASIGAGFKAYDIRFFAHRTFGDIDYQLCQPTPETLLGIDYISSWLERLHAENTLLNAFDPQRVNTLLTAYCAGYKVLLVNLYEPVAANAAALALLGGDVFTLHIDEIALADLAKIFDPITAAQISAALAAAAKKACAELKINSPFAREYMSIAVQSLTPRIIAARDFGGLNGIFTKLNP